MAPSSSSSARAPGAMGSRFAPLPAEATGPPAAVAVSGRASRKRKTPRVVVVTTAKAAKAACRELSKHSVLGLDCEGVALSRTGSLQLVQVCSGNGNVVYVFDVGTASRAEACFTGTSASGGSAGVGGLRALLEAAGPVKVVHDCRHDSDALWHQHGVRLGNVIDLQVAFAECRALKGLGRGLPASLRTVLLKHAPTGTVAERELQLKQAVKGAMRAQPDYWATRPLTAEQLEYACFDVAHLVRAAQALRRVAEKSERAEPNGSGGKAWVRIRAQSEEYASQFRDDPDGMGPEKANRLYEDMARTAARERTHSEFNKARERMRRKDPLRQFNIDQPQVLCTMLNIPFTGGTCGGASAGASSSTIGNNATESNDSSSSTTPKGALTTTSIGNGTGTSSNVVHSRGEQVDSTDTDVTQLTALAEEVLGAYRKTSRVQ